MTARLRSRRSRQYRRVFWFCNEVGAVETDCGTAPVGSGEPATAACSLRLEHAPTVLARVDSQNQHRKHTKGVLQFPFRSANDDSSQDNFLIHQRVAHPLSSGNPGTIRAVNEFGVPTPAHKGESTMSEDSLIHSKCNASTTDANEPCGRCGSTQKS